jgi:hypothetical protein
MLRQERSARPKRVFPVEPPNQQSAGHLRLRTRKTAWLVTQGRVTTIFAADTPAFRASKAAWSISRPWPTIFAGGAGTNVRAASLRQELAVDHWTNLVILEARPGDVRRLDSK